MLDERRGGGDARRMRMAVRMRRLEIARQRERQAKEIDRTLKALQDGALAELGMLANRLA